MQSINTFCLATLMLASIMTAVHYVVARAKGMAETFETEAPHTPVLSPVAEPEKFDAAAGAKWVEEARATAMLIASERDDGCCDADAVWFECPPPPGVDGRLLAAVFDRSTWEIVDRKMSARGRNAARQIAVWRLKREAMAA